MTDRIKFSRAGALRVTGHRVHVCRDSDAATVTDGVMAVMFPWEPSLRECGDLPRSACSAVREMAARPARSRGYIGLADALQWSISDRVGAYGHDAQVCLGHIFDRKLIRASLCALSDLGTPSDAELLVEATHYGDKWMLRMSSMLVVAVACQLDPRLVTVKDCGNEPMPTRPRSAYLRAA